MTFRSRVTRGLQWQLINIAGRQLISLAVFTTLARLLDPSAFGRIGLVGVYLSIVSMFVDQGIGLALVQRKDLDPEHLDTAFWFSAGAASVLCIGTLIFATPLSTLLGDTSLASLLRWLSLVLVLNSLADVHAAQFSRQLDFRRPTLRILVANATGGIVGITMAFLGFGVWALVGQQLCAAAAGTLFFWIVSPWRPRWRVSFPHLRQLLPVSGSILGTDLLWQYAYRLDQVVIGRVAGAGVLGQYVVAGKLPELMRSVVHGPLAAVAMPAFSRIQSDHQQLCRAIYRGMELNALVSFAIFIGLAAVSHTLVPLVFGSQWVLASSLLGPVAVYGLFIGLFVYCQPALLASGGPGKYVLINIVCAVGATVACTVGIRFGVRAVVVGLIANLLLTGTLALLFLRRRIGLDLALFCRPIIAPALAASLMFIAVSGLSWSVEGHLTPWLELALQVACGAAVYLGSMYAMSPKSLRSFFDILLHDVMKRPRTSS